MPVGKGSIARATSASNKNNQVILKTVKERTNILTDIPLDQIQLVPVDWMNSKYQNQSVKEIIISIQKFGMIEPVILRRVTDNQFQLLSGYQRLQAAREIGMDFISSRIIDGLSEEEAKDIYLDLHKKMMEDNRVIHDNDTIHQTKFKVITTVSKDLPNYLL